MEVVALIVPAETYRAAAFLAAAKALGVEVVVVSDTQQTLAPTMGEHFMFTPFDDPVAAAAAIVEHATRIPLTAVVAIDDTGGLIAAMACEQLGLLHNSPAAIRVTRDKAVMRELCAAHHVNQPDFGIAHFADDAPIAERVVKLANAIGYPVVIKPNALSASRGVIRANNDEEAAHAATWAMRIAQSSDIKNTALLVEAFIAGPEFALEGRLHDGELNVLAIFDKPVPLDGPYFEESIYITPSTLSELQCAAVHDTVRDACLAIGLSTGPVHAEVRLDSDAAGKVVFLEVAARTIGGRCSGALRFSNGVTIEQIVLGDALQRPYAPIAREDAASGVLMLPIPKQGRLVAIENQDAALQIPGIVGIDITVAPGRHVRPFPESDRYLGFVFAHADSPEACLSALRRCEEILSITIESDQSNPVSATP